MNKKENLVCLETYDSSCAIDHIHKTDHLTLMVKEVHTVVVALAADKEIHYGVVYKSSRSTLYKTETGKVVLKALRGMHSNLKMFGHENQCLLNPFFKVFHSAYMMDSVSLYKVCFGQRSLSARKCVEILNGFVDRVRLTYADADLQPFLKRLRRGARQRAQSMVGCLNHSFDLRSRLLVTRIDLKYSEGIFVGMDLAYGLSLVKSHWTQMYNALHNGLVDHLRAFVARIEYGILSGYHIHLLLFFDGSDRRGDIIINAIIGEYWTEHVTQRAGYYWNCNMYKNKYPTPALGMVEHTDTKKRTILENVLLDYLAKPDAITAMYLPYERTLFRSVIPSRPIHRRGRQRLQSL